MWGTNVVANTQQLLGIQGDYIDFQSNNTAFFKAQGVLDTVNYAVVSNSQIIYDNDTFTINTLNTSSFIFEYKDRISANYFDNIVIVSK
jgi:hypothetical protein